MLETDQEPDDLSEQGKRPRRFTPIRHLGRTVFIAVALSVVLAQFFRVSLLAIVGLLVALVLPRFLFRRHIVVAWSRQDWIWLALSGLALVFYARSTELW
ncbi:hypothetical protein [Candidatus Nitrospira bockiana]